MPLYTQKVGLLGLGFKFVHQNEYQEADPGGQPGTNLEDVQVLVRLASRISLQVARYHF